MKIENAINCFKNAVENLDYHNTWTGFLERGTKCIIPFLEKNISNIKEIDINNLGSIEFIESLCANYPGKEAFQMEKFIHSLPLYKPDVSTEEGIDYRVRANEQLSYIFSRVFDEAKKLNS